MPSKVRVISGPRNESFDHHIADVISRGAWGLEHDYFGLEDPEEASYVRRKLVTAGKHMDPPVAVKAFWVPCTGCNNGGQDCRYHVMFTVYDMDKARAYRARMDKATGRRSS